MNKYTIQKLKTSRLLSTLIILSGALLMIYMITIEDEPGALPLLLIISGAGWFILNQILIKKGLR